MSVGKGIIGSVMKPFGLRICFFMLAGTIGAINCYADPVDMHEGDVLIGHKRHPEHDIHRLKVTGDITGIMQGLINNNNADDPSDSADLSYSADLFFEFPVPVNETSFVNVHLDMGGGEGITNTIGDAFGGPNADLEFDSATVNIVEAYYESTYISGLLTFSIGKLDATAYFDGNDMVNDETQQFLAGEFVNNAAVEFPDYAAGLRLTFIPTEIVYVSVGAFEGDADFDNIFNRPFFMGEVGLTANLLGRTGNYRAYLFSMGTDHDKVDGNGGVETNWGAGVSLDQYITEAFGLFARFGFQNPKVSEFHMTESFGIELHGSAFGRDKDVFAAAYGIKHLSSDYENANGTTDVEGYLEVFYSIALHDTFHISPDFQWIHNPKAESTRDDIFIYGIRGQVDF